jgi:D-methionine transport system substrate-binding protein
VGLIAADNDKPRVKVLVDSYRTPELKDFILTKVKGAVLPSW